MRTYILLAPKIDINTPSVKMQSTSTTSNNLQLIGTMLEVLEIISGVTENTTLYRQVNKLIIQLGEIRYNNKLNWYDTIIGHDPELLIELYSFFTYRSRWQREFIAVYSRNYYGQEKNLVALFEKMDEIVSVLDKVVHIDYAKMREDNREFVGELSQYVLNPERVEKMSRQFGLENLDYLVALQV